MFHFSFSPKYFIFNAHKKTNMNTEYCGTTMLNNSHCYYYEIINSNMHAKRNSEENQQGKRISRQKWEYKFLFLLILSRLVPF